MASQTKIQVGISYDFKKAKTEFNNLMTEIEKSPSAKNAGKTPANAYKIWWRKALESRDVKQRKMETALEVKSEASSKKQADAYVKWWNKALGNKEIKQREAIAKAEAAEIASAQKSASEYTAKSQAINDAIRARGKETARTATSTQSLGARTIDLTNRTSEASSSIGQMTSALKNSVVQMTTVGVAMASLYSSIRKMKEGIGFLIETDNQMATIRAITGKTRVETDALVKSYIAMGDALGISSDKIIDASVALYRQGLSTEQVDERLQVLIKTSSALGENLTDTTEKVTASINSMGVTAQRTTDVVTLLGSISATSGGEILTAIQRSAGAAGVTNTSLEELATTIALISSKTRIGAESVGASVSTILSKLAQVNSMTGETNKDFGKIVTRMNEYGIEVKDASGELLRPFELMQNLAQEWDGLSNKAKSFLTGAIGVKQLSKFSAALSDVDEQQRLLNGALSASGEVNKQYEERLTTTTVAIERMNNEFQRLANDTMNSTVLTSFIDMSTKTLKLVTDLNLLQVGLITLGSVIAVFTARRMAIMITQFAQFIIMAKNLGIQMALLTVEMSAATLATGGLIAVVGLLAFAVVTYNKAEEKRIEQAKKTIENAKQELTEIQKLEKAYDTLSTASSEDVKSKEELLEIQKMLNKEYPQLIGNMRDEGDQYLTNIPKLQEYTKEKKKALLEDLKISELAMKADAERRNREKSDLEKERDKLKTGINKGYAKSSDRSVGGSIVGMTAGKEHMAQVIQDRQGQIDELDAQNEQYNSVITQIAELENMLSDDYVPPVFEDVDSGDGSGGGDTVLGSGDDDKTKFLSDEQNALNQINRELSLLQNQNEAGLATDQQVIDKLIDKQDALEKLANLYRSQQSGLKEGSEELDKNKEAVASLSAEHYSAKKAIEAFAEAEKAELLKALKETNKELEEQKDKLEELADTYKDNLSEAISDSIDLLEQQRDKSIEATESSIEALEDEIKAIKDANAEKEKANALAEKELELAKLKLQRSNILKERNTKILRDGKFVFEANPADLRKNAEAIADTEQELIELKKKNEYEERIAKLEADKEALEEQKRGTKESYDNRIKALKDFNTEQKRQIKREGKIQESLLDNIRGAIIASDRAHWKETVDGYKNMVDQINSALAGIKTVQSDININQQDQDAGGRTNTIRVREISTGNELEISRGVWEGSADVRRRYEALNTGGRTLSDGVAMLHKDEVVLNPAQVSRTVGDLGLQGGSPASNAQSLFNFANGANLPQFSTNNNTTTSSPIDQSINIDSVIVNNPADFKGFTSELRSRTRNRS